MTPDDHPQPHPTEEYVEPVRVVHDLPGHPDLGRGRLVTYEIPTDPQDELQCDSCQ